MKKIITSIAFIVSFAAYALYQHVSAPPTAAIALSSTPTPSTSPAPASSPSSSGAYRNGTYVGNAADAYYGNVQVKVTIASSKISDVAFLDYPHDRGTSREINSFATPLLRSEAIRSQTASVSGVSGATDTSAAFRQSLASALAQAKA